MDIKIPRIGMRSIKTVIATFIAIIASNVLGFETPFYATWTAFLCIQASIVESSKMGVKRSIGTLIGGVFALVYLVFVPYNIYMIPLGIFVIIYLCNLIDRKDLISISSVVFLVISFRVNTIDTFEPVAYVITRFIETFVGIVIAFLVNYYIKPPNPFIKLGELNKDMIEIIKMSEINTIEKIDGFREGLEEFRGLIDLYEKEINKDKIDIDYYKRQLTYFQLAYSHMLLLNSSKEKMNENTIQYHLTSLMDIRRKLNQ